MITIKRIRFLVKTPIHLVAFLCGITYPIGIHAQHANISFEHFSAAQGLSAPVNHIAQDKLGFLWFGTTDGLNRFDGINFIVYRHIPGDSTSIPNNLINALHVDKEGRVWAATNGGLCYYDFNDDRFHKIHFDATLETLDQHRVHGVSSGKDNVIWFATRTMIHRLDNLDKLKSIKLPNATNVLIKYIYTDDHGNVWIGSNEGMHVYNNATGKFLHGKISSPFTIKNNLGVTVHPIMPFKTDTVIIGSWYAGLQKVYIHHDSIIGIPFEDLSETDPRRHIVSGLAPGTGPNWWIGTYGNGLAWFDTEKNKFVDHFHHDPSDARSLSDDYINDVFTDASGIVWIGTSKGLDKFDPLTQQFTTVPIPLPDDQFAVYRLVNTIVQDILDPASLWLCVSGAGLFHYNKIKQTFNLYPIDNDGEDALARNNIYSFYYRDDGKAWIGTRAGVYIFDTRTKAFTALREPLNKIPSAHTILQDKKGNFWFATNSDGIYLYNETENNLISYKYDPANPNSIPDNKVFCLLEDSEGKIWLGTQNRGLCSIDPVKKEFRFFMHDQKNANSIPDNGVYDLFEDANHHLWITTENGFADMDMRTYQIKNYNTSNGLCNNTVFSITQDHQHHFWLGTNNGLSHFSPSSGQFRNYYTNDGLPINRIDGEVFLGPDSILYFGTTGMITFSRPDKMTINKRIPSIVITDVSILGKEVPVMRNADMLQPIHLNYKQNMITFNFASLNFSNAFLNQYAYKLEGFDDTWINCGNQQSATYTNLNGGAYTFRVKGANNDGVWNENGTHVLLYVHPPFWKTWWFYLLCTLAVAGVLYLIYKVRINQLMRLQTIRTRIARDLHDDIGSTLSSINMISSMAKGNDGSRKKASEMFNTISSASGQAMELMSDIVWSINPKNDSMEMIIIRMRQYASEILEAANISFTIELNGFDKRVQLPLEIRKDFYLIFKEAINNLAKYSHAQHARITMNFSHNMIHLVIEDDGVGFDMTEIVGGNGMKNMEARSRDIKGEISIYSMPGAGTRVSLDIPLTP